MKELDYFKYFKQHQLHSVDFTTGRLDVIAVKSNQHGKHTAIITNIGSRNTDGYIRVWCGDKYSIGKKLLMRHRLLYWLYHGELPEGKEIDHKNRVRGDDVIDNLRVVDRSTNCKNTDRSAVKANTYSDLLISRVCILLQDTELSDEKIAIQCGISRQYVRDIKTRRRKAKLSKDYQWYHRVK